MPYNRPGVVSPSGSGDFVKMDQIVLGADGTITFSAIPGTYENLHISFWGQATDGSDTTLALRFNGDTGANYDDVRTVAVGTTNAAGGNTGATLGVVAEISRTANTSRATAIAIDIPAYARTAFFKVCTAGATDIRGTATNDRLTSFGGCLWRSTAAITSILMLSGSGGTLQAGSVATLYGLK